MPVSPEECTKIQKVFTDKCLDTIDGKYVDISTWKQWKYVLQLQRDF
jgi:hypothetical protein